jgi:hypothetical protein
VLVKLTGSRGWSMMPSTDKPTIPLGPEARRTWACQKTSVKPGSGWVIDTPIGDCQPVAIVWTTVCVAAREASPSLAASAGRTQFSATPPFLRFSGVIEPL